MSSNPWMMAYSTSLTLGYHDVHQTLLTRTKVLRVVRPAWINMIVAKAATVTNHMAHRRGNDQWFVDDHHCLVEHRAKRAPTSGTPTASMKNAARVCDSLDVKPLSKESAIIRLRSRVQVLNFGLVLWAPSYCLGGMLTMKLRGNSGAVSSHPV